MGPYNPNSITMNFLFIFYLFNILRQEKGIYNGKEYFKVVEKYIQWKRIKSQAKLNN